LQPASRADPQAREHHEVTRDQPERQYANRTAELERLNRQLQAEVVERRRAELAEYEQRVLAEALRDTLATINSALDMDDVMRHILESVGQVVAHDAADIMLIEDGVAVIRYTHGYDRIEGGDDPLGVKFTIASVPHMQKVIRQGTAAVISDVRDYPEWVLIKPTKWIRSHIAAPIRLEGATIGFLNVNSARAGTLTEKHGQRLQAFADQAAIAVRNARLVSQMRQELAHRRQAEAALRWSQEQLRATLDALGDRMFVVDSSLRITLTNQPFEHMTADYGIETTPLGRTPFELFPFLPQSWHEDYAHIFATGEVITTQETTRIGSVETVTETHKIPIYEKDQVVRVVTVMRDITELKLAEEQALQLAIERERSTILANFISDTSHEFATPLSVIKNDLYLLEHTDDPASDQARLSSLGGQIAHLERLVQGLLLMSRLDRGMAFNFQPTNLNQLLTTLHESHITAAERNHQTLTIDLTDTPLPLQADVNLLHTALGNLVENARMFTPEAGSIIIRSKRQHDQAVVEVCDTGCGIPADEISRIFERFYRIEQARETSGAGLGLPIAQSIVARHGGRIEVQSEPGTGSIFRVFLPIAPG